MVPRDRGPESPWAGEGLPGGPRLGDAPGGVQQSGQVDGWTSASSRAQPFPEQVMGSPGVQRSGCWSGGS